MTHISKRSLSTILSQMLLLTLLGLTSPCHAAIESPDQLNTPKTFKDCNHCPEMVVVPGGTFIMGEDDPESYAYPPHQVTLSSFAIAKYPVTQKLWKMVMGEKMHKINKYVLDCGDDCPITYVDWLRARAFAKLLSKVTKHTYRLPTEAEWEYACRSGGKDQKYCGSDKHYANLKLDQINDVHAWPIPVHETVPNDLSIYGMACNITEWTLDWIDRYKKQSVVQSSLPAEEPSDGIWEVMVRGGRVYKSTECNRATKRQSRNAFSKNAFTTFRLVRELTADEPTQPDVSSEK